MLNTQSRGRAAVPRRSGQHGVVLLLALIMLVVLTLAGIALVRSVSTSNVIAGNLAFQQAATNAADVGVETAVTWLEANNTGTVLASDQTATIRYLAARQDPAAGQTWDNFWTNNIPASAVNTLAQDASGNTVAFVIHRLCNTVGAAASAGCSAPPNDASSAGNSQGAGVVALKASPQVYYRITVRVAGPRSTVSYVQAVVAL